MENHITRRHALALTSAAFATSCADNKAISARSAAPEPAPNLDTWSEGVPLPFPAQEIYPCAHSGKIHLAGGFIAENGRITGPTAAHHYFSPDPFRNFTKWLSGIALPTARHHPHMISFDGKLLALAGFESHSEQATWIMQKSCWREQGRSISQSQTDVFDDDGVRILDRICVSSIKCEVGKDNGVQENCIGSCESLEFQPMPALPSPCAEAVVGVTGNNTLHLAGGRTPKGEANANWNDHIDTDHHFVLTSLTGKWETAAPCLTKRNSAAGDVINGNLHIVGGRTVGGGNVATHEVYDHAEDRWRNATPMPQAQGGLAAAAVNGKLYAFGGEFFDNGGGVYKEAWAYDPATDAWSALLDMPNPRHGLGAVALDGKIYVIGGALQASGVDTSNIVDIFTPD